MFVWVLSSNLTKGLEYRTYLAIIFLSSILLTITGYYGSLILIESSTLYLVFLVLVASSIIIWLAIDNVFSDILVICMLMSLFTSIQLIMPTTFVGWDINGEWRIFNVVFNNQKWYPDQPQHLYNTVLSITILPLIFQEISGLSSFYFMKYFSSVIYALAIYLVYKLTDNIFPKLYRAIGLILLLSQIQTYSEMTSISRQEIALFILAVAFLFLIKGKCVGSSAFLLASAALMHYSSFFMIIVAILVGIISIRFFNFENVRGLALSFLVACIAGFLWYSYIVWTGVLSKSALIIYDILFEIEHYLTGKPISPPGISVLMRPFNEPNVFASILHYISKFLGALFFVLLLFGFILALKLETKKRTIKSRYVIFTLGFLAIFLISLSSNYVASTLNLSRFISTSLIFLAPYIGYSTFGLVGRVTKKFLFFKKVIYLITFLSVLTFFLIQSGVLWEISGSNTGTFPLRSFWCIRYGDAKQAYEASIFLGTAADNVISAFIIDYFPKHSKLDFDIGSYIRYFSVYSNYIYQVQRHDSYIFLSIANIRSGLWIKNGEALELNKLLTLENETLIFSSSNALILRRR